MGMFRTAFGICKNEGMLMLWQGISPSLTRHVVYSGVRLTVYEKLREYVVQNSTGINPVNSNNKAKDQISSRTHMSLHHRIICGMTSGAIGQFCASPADLLKVKMQMQGRERLMLSMTERKDATNRPLNMIQIFLDVIKKGGVVSLWKGRVFNYCNLKGIYIYIL